MKIWPLYLILFLLSLIGCDLFEPEESYAPVQEGLISLDDGTHSYKLFLPDGFEDDENYMTLYPLVIGLHGRTSSTTSYYVVNQVKDAYPCVYFAPNNTDQGFRGDNAAWIREELHSIIENKNYKIDRSRIYMIGFSMGGWGCTTLPQDLYKDYGYLTAAIVPVDGAYFPYIKSTEVLDNISCWLHQGTYDLEDDYAYAKAYYSNTLETVVEGSFSYSNSWSPDTVISYDTTTYTLYQSNRKKTLLTIYHDMGHTAGPVFNNPEVVEWIFEKRTGN